jgi:hypothetical protein
MERVTSSHWKSLEQWSPLAFLGAGVLLLGHAIVMGVQAFTDVTTPTDVFAPVGHLLALVGLVGLYSVFADHAPRLARAGAVLAAVIAVGWVAVTVSILGTSLGNPSSQTEALLGILSMVVLTSTILPYVVYGVAVLRTDATRRTVGLLLLAPAALLAVLLVDIAILGASPLDGVVVGTGLAFANLTVGFTLRTGGVPIPRPSSNGDVTPG